MKQTWLILLWVVCLSVVFAVGCKKSAAIEDAQETQETIIEEEEENEDEEEIYEALPPELKAPRNGAVLDNGCTDRQDDIIWYFEWGAVKGAERYHLYVKGSAASIPIIDNRNIDATFFRFRSHGGYIADRNRFDWRWKVKCRVNGIWSDWSNERYFDVEPLCLD